MNVWYYGCRTLRRKVETRADVCNAYMHKNTRLLHSLLRPLQLICVNKLNMSRSLLDLRFVIWIFSYKYCVWVLKFLITFLEYYNLKLFLKNTASNYTYILIPQSTKTDVRPMWSGYIAIHRVYLTTCFCVLVFYVWRVCLNKHENTCIVWSFYCNCI